MTDLEQIAKEYNYPIRLIKDEECKTFKIMKQAYIDRETNELKYIQKMNNQSKFTNECFKYSALSVFKMLETDELPYLAMGRYGEDKSKDMYTMFMTNLLPLKVYVDYNIAKDDFEATVKEFNEYNKHLKCIGIKQDFINDGFVRNVCTIQLTYDKN